MSTAHTLGTAEMGHWGGGCGASLRTHPLAEFEQRLPKTSFPATDRHLLEKKEA